MTQYLCIDIFDKFIRIFKPFISIFVLEITTHSHNDMICCKTVRLKDTLMIYFLVVKIADELRYVQYQ